ncbi:DALR domain-containing protein [Thermoproteota archaeon]
MDNFFEALNDDLDIPKAINVLIILIRVVNENMASANQDLFNKILKMLTIIGLESLGE